MTQCKCGSYAINDDPTRELCDKCWRDKRIAELKAENAAMLEAARWRKWPEEKPPDHDSVFLFARHEIETPPSEVDALKAEVDRLNSVMSIADNVLKEGKALVAERDTMKAEVTRLTGENAALVRDSARLRCDNARWAAEMKAVADAERDALATRVRELEGMKSSCGEPGIRFHRSLHTEAIRCGEGGWLCPNCAPKKEEKPAEWEIYSRTYHTEKDFCCGMARVEIPGPGTFRVTVEKNGKP